MKSLPKLLVITEAATMKGGFEPALLAALQGGAQWVQFRERELAPRPQIEAFRRSQRLCERFGAQLFLNGRADVARAVHAEGLHLPEWELPVDAARLSLGFHTPIGVSVHSVESAKRAASEGADYLLFGAVYPTLSHPGMEPAGLAALGEVTAAVPIPVYAVGGITVERVPQCLEAGAAGIAVIRAVWAAADPPAAVRALRAALGEPVVTAHHGPSSLPDHLKR